MKKLFYLLTLFILFSCGFKNKTTDQIKPDSINIYHGIVRQLNDSIAALNDTIFKIKNKNANIDKIEIVKLSELKKNDLYIKHCKFCHGEYGDGDGIKARVNKELCPYDLSKEQKSDKEVYYIILHGLNKMPSQKELSEDQIWVLVVYIKKFKDDDHQ